MDWKLKIKKIVAYTDGSAYPNSNIIEAKNGYSCIFTDGYIEGLALYGSSPQFIINEFTKEKMFSNSQRAEGTAILKCMIKCNSLPMNKWDEIEIITDSKHWYNMINSFMPRWDKDKFKEMKMPDITMEIDKLWKELNYKGKITIRHINSHGKGGLKEAEEGSQENYDYINNCNADKLANLAREKLEYNEYVEKKDILE